MADDEEETEDRSAEEKCSDKFTLNADDTQSTVDINNNSVSIVFFSIEVNQSERVSTETDIIQTGQWLGRKRERRSENGARNIRQNKCSREKYMYIQEGT